MKYCLNCGKGIPDESKFCTFCGAAVPVIDPKNPTALKSEAETENKPAPVDNNLTAAGEQTSPPAKNQKIETSHGQYSVANEVNQPQYPDANKQAHVYGSKNEFYKNAGFWGAVILLLGFFLPYVNGADISFFTLVTEYSAQVPVVFMYLVFPVSAVIIILQGLTGILPKFLVVIFKILPVLLILLFIVTIVKNPTSVSSFGSDAGTILGNLGIGFYMTLVGSLLILFFRTTKVRLAKSSRLLEQANN